MNKNFKYWITDHKGEQVYLGQHEKYAIEALDSFIDSEEGYFYLWEQGFDEPIQSGGLTDYET